MGTVTSPNGVPDGKTLMRGSLMAVVAWAGVAGISSAQALAMTPCIASLQEVRDDPALWQADVRLTCGPDAAGAENTREVPTGLPVLIGITLQPQRDDYWDGNPAGEIDFPAQVITIDPVTAATVARFRVPRSQVTTADGAQIGIWPVSAIRPCVNDRSGCAKYGYALGANGSLESECTDAAADSCFNVVDWSISLRPEEEPTDDAAEEAIEE